MKRILLLISAALLLCGCVTKSRVYTWLDKNPQEASRYAQVHFPPKTVFRPGETIIKRDTITKRDTVEYSTGGGNVVRIPCPECNAIYVHSSTTDTFEVSNTAEVEFERRRANEAERSAEVQKGRNEVLLGKVDDADKKAAQRLWGIIGLSAVVLGLLYLLFRR